MRKSQPRLDSRPEYNTWQDDGDRLLVEYAPRYMEKK